jgi:hypothetical protein
MIEQIYLAGTFKLPGTSITLNRMGYRAKRLAGSQVWGQPRISTQSGEHQEINHRRVRSLKESIPYLCNELPRIWRQLASL